ERELYRGLDDRQAACSAAQGERLHGEGDAHLVQHGRGGGKEPELRPGARGRAWAGQRSGRLGRGNHRGLPDRASVYSLEHGRHHSGHGQGPVDEETRPDVGDHAGILRAVDLQAWPSACTGIARVVRNTSMKPREPRRDEHLATAPRLVGYWRDPDAPRTATLPDPRDLVDPKWS